jgi:predicted methyltransferase
MTMRKIIPVALVLALATALPAAHHEAKTDAVAAALADPARPEADKARDATRRPAELLAFANVKPGDHVLDFIMGGGYLTRILAGAVGPMGRVYAYQPAEFVGFLARYGTDQDNVAKAHANVTPLRAGVGTFAVPGPVDAIVTVQNYHDLHLAMAAPDTAAKANAVLFKALKPGGTLVVVDHVAAPGSGLTVPDKLHRIDPAIVRAELEAAGFRFDGELTLWRNPADPHTASAFDPSIRGKTDQFAYRFRKPE